MSSLDKQPFFVHVSIDTPDGEQLAFTSCRLEMIQDEYSLADQPSVVQLYPRVSRTQVISDDIFDMINDVHNEFEEMPSNRTQVKMKFSLKLQDGKFKVMVTGVEVGKGIGISIGIDLNLKSCSTISEALNCLLDANCHFVLRLGSRVFEIDARCDKLSIIAITPKQLKRESKNIKLHFDLSLINLSRFRILDIHNLRLTKCDLSQYGNLSMIFGTRTIPEAIKFNEATKFYYID